MKNYIGEKIKTLRLLLTHSFSFGLNENWEKTDLKILSQMNDQIYFCPINYYNGTEKTLNLLQDTVVVRPLNYPSQKDTFTKKILNRIPRNKAQLIELLQMLTVDLILGKRCLQSMNLQNKIMYVFQGEMKDKLSQCGLNYFFWVMRAHKV